MMIIITYVSILYNIYTPRTAPPPSCRYSRPVTITISQRGRRRQTSVSFLFIFHSSRRRRYRSFVVFNRIEKTSFTPLPATSHHCTIIDIGTTIVCIYIYRYTVSAHRVFVRFYTSSSFPPPRAARSYNNCSDLAVRICDSDVVASAFLSRAPRAEARSSEVILSHYYYYYIIQWECINAHLI